MSKINLLPWRDELRKKNNQIFFTFLFISGLAAFLVVLLIHLVFTNIISSKKLDEDYLIRELDANKSLIQEVEGIDNKKQELLSRVNVIQSLQSNRVFVVRLLDALAKGTPDGVVLNKITRQDKTVTILGNADSNNAISFFMRNLDDLDWIETAKLTDVRGQEGNSAPTSGVSGASPEGLSFTISLVEK